jgi:GDP-4-dehydro-6-deoxy-D-mannose reductase
VLAAVAEHAPDCAVVLPGSAAEYGETDEFDGPVAETSPVHPVAPYGVVKAEQTLLALEAASRGLRVVVARVFNLCGAGTPERLVLGGVAAQLRRIAAGEQEPVVTTGDLSAVRDFIDVGDACAALLALAETGVPGQTYNVCSGRPTVVEDAVRSLVELSGTGATVAARPAAPARGNVPWSVGRNEKLRAATGWSPRTPLTESLAAMLG